MVADPAVSQHVFTEQPLVAQHLLIVLIKTARKIKRHIQFNFAPSKRDTNKCNSVSHMAECPQDTRRPVTFPHFDRVKTL